MTNKFIVFGLVILGSCNNNVRRESFGDDISSSSSLIRNQVYSPIIIDETKTIYLKFEEALEKIDDQKYVALSSEELIEGIDKLLVYNEKIYILDAFAGEKIFIFDMSGKLIKVIDDKGQGPEEYTGLFDMSIDSKNNKLIVYDAKSSKLFYYTLNGEFVKRERNLPCVDFNILNDSTKLLHMTFEQSFKKGVNFSLIVAVNDFVVRKGFPLKRFQESIPLTHSLINNSNGNLLFTPIACDTVYQILSDSTYRVRYVIKQKKSIWDYCKNREEHFGNARYKNMIIKEGYSSVGGEFYETENFISFILMHQEAEGVGDGKHLWSKNYFYNKQKDKLYSLIPVQNDKNFIKKELSFGIIFPPNPVGIYGNSFVSVLTIGHVLKIKDACKKGIFKVKDQKLKSIVEQYNEDNNPVLVFFRLK